MENYSLENFKRHWENNRDEFVKEYEDWVDIFSDLLSLSSEAAEQLAGARALKENCSYLLLSKALNHCLATYSLIERGLIIDAALSARNAIETLLMLELFSKDQSKSHFEEWAKGKQYKPGYIRKRLKSLKEVPAGDIIVSMDQQYYEDLQFAYDWLCRITHSNLDSLQHSISKQNTDSIIVFIGGTLKGQNSFINAIFSIMCSCLWSSVLVCMAVLKLSYFEMVKEKYSEIKNRIDEKII